MRLNVICRSSSNLARSVRTRRIMTSTAAAGSVTTPAGSISPVSHPELIGEGERLVPSAMLTDGSRRDPADKRADHDADGRLTSAVAILASSAAWC